jgi:hypothetical protein
VSARKRGKPRVADRLWIASVARPFDKALEALSLKVDRLADHGEAPASFVEFIVVGVDSLCIAHTSIVGGRSGALR